MNSRIHLSALRTHPARGFGLVEVMVGVVIGMITVLVIMQVFATFEGQKRTTTAGADAQANGLLALRTLESEIRMAGYGITTNGSAACTGINYYYDDGDAGTPDLHTNGTMMPARIADGGAGSDTIEVLYSASAFGSAPARLVQDMPVPSNVTKVNNLAGINVCDFVLYAAPGSNKPCTRLQVTGLEPNNVQFQTGSGQSDYNPAGGANDDLFPSGGYTIADGAVIINMGSFVDKRFQVTKTTGKDEYFFRVVNLDSAASGCAGAPAPAPDVDLVGNIVNIQAQYGIADAGAQNVNCWVDASNITSGSCGIGNWAAPTAAEVNRIKAIRVAVVARSQLPEKPPTIGGTCDATTSAPISWEGGPTIDLSADPNWQCYRYKVYQTIVPIRNVIWANI